VVDSKTLDRLKRAIYDPIQDARDELHLSEKRDKVLENTAEAIWIRVNETLKGYYP